ncbi:Protein transport protein SEC16B [Ananas comosus]|uniref:Protein transport protein sec16 n=1 Tax=Ananas comosus TaxID=4615 RepID=A0A199VGP2_ANACO|nr:Protein transport protein SEC16B [Ananas comosus]
MVSPSPPPPPPPPPPPAAVEDQTDEDFFDKLVIDDDEFGVEGSHAVSKDMARDFSNLSLGNIGASLDDLGDSGFPSEIKPTKENNGLPPASDPPKDDGVLKHEESGPFGSQESIGEVASPGSVVVKGDGSKGTSVKEVQWSAFSSDTQPFGQGGFGSYSDFLKEDGSSENFKSDTNVNGSFVENPVENQNLYGGYYDQQETQYYGSTNEQVPDANDAQYWENLYPGWKYDASTGQWYQVDSIDTTTAAAAASTNTQWDNYTATSMDSQVYGQNSTATTAAPAAPANESFEMKSDVSYLQQTTQSVLDTIAEESTTNSITNLNQEYQASTEYPPNMVFDPQYPGWYYDTNTQQWYTLESYMQTTQVTSSTVQDQVNQDYSASAGFGEQHQNQNYAVVGQLEQSTIQGTGNQEFGGDWNNYNQQTMWQPEAAGNNNTESLSGNQLSRSFYGSMGNSVGQTNQQVSFKTFEPVTTHNYGSTNGVASSQSFVPSESMYQFNQPKLEQNQQAYLSNSYYGNQNSMNFSQQSFQNADPSYSQFSYIPHEGRSSAGRPAHALVAFGFGGKLIVMKDASSFSTKLDYGNQGTSGGTVSIHSLSEIVMNKTDASSFISGGAFGYFQALCQQSFPGPLVGGNAATKDVNKWLDERIMSCESISTDVQKGEFLRLLLSLLKISCQHYGKLRSPFGSGPSVEENDGPEMAITRLFASAKKASAHLNDYGSVTHCMQSLPSESQIRATAVEVQNLLVSGRRKEALQYAQDGQLWGAALVLAAQLGEKFYVDTVKKMAHRQFVSGSPLRTLCLLIAGQPADVFSGDSPTNSTYGVLNALQQPMQNQTSGMLDDWAENLAIITANRTKDDELVMIHLGDCLWKERGEVTAAHTCYLVAEANFEAYSESARLCLVGADHWKCPRTFASPESIQRTELYEYSKVLGNSQYILLPFQPYKLIYAHMLAEVGKISDSLRYCQASLRMLKSSGRAPEGGYNTNLAPAKFVGKIFTSIDKSIHRMIGAPPPPLPPMPQGSVSSVNDKERYAVAPQKFVNSQSAMAMSSLMPSASVESISEWTGDNSGVRKSMHNRSVSEPDFGRSPKQKAGSVGTQSKSAELGSSRFGRFGSTLLQKTMGWVSRSHRQAKLGESNKFYYDEKLKRWVEEGAETPAEEAALPPPPTTTSFQNGMPDYNTNISSHHAVKSELHTANGIPEAKPPNLSEFSPGIPPIPPSQNQFSALGRAGVRSRYVDTFNKGGGGGTATNLFQSPPAAPSVKPAVNAKFFIPSAPVTVDEKKTKQPLETSQEPPTTSEELSTSAVTEVSFSSPPSASSSSPSMQRFPSMDNMTPYGNRRQGPVSERANGPISRTRAASWSGNFGDSFNTVSTESKPNSLDGQTVPSSFMPAKSLQFSGSSLSDDLHEVEL